MTSRGEPPILLSCDTIVVSNGRAGNLFGKNSDRPEGEAQGLVRIPAAQHAAGAVVQCQYLSIPQAPETFEVLGSQPAWLWGFEQGVNAAGVAIGNEAVYSKEPVAESGLLGMDLVRLALERADSAHAAVNVITSLLEEHGQGGAATEDGSRSYHNSFLVADAESILIVETSGRNWVVRDAPEGAALSNMLTIDDNWTSHSEGIQEAAARAGLVVDFDTNERFNFRATFEDNSARVWSQARYLASCMMVQRQGHATLEDMMRHLRDHFEGGTVHVLDASAEHVRPRSVCMHPGTAASMIVELTPDSGPPIAWCSMATPCTSIFIPVPVGSQIPEALRSANPDGSSLWWRMREIQRVADARPDRLTPPIQSFWAQLEREVIERVRADANWASQHLDELVERVLKATEQLLSSHAA